MALISSTLRRVGYGMSPPVIPCDRRVLTAPPGLSYDPSYILGPHTIHAHPRTNTSNRYGVPAVVDQGIKDDKIIDVKCVTLGETADEYVISFIEKDGKGGTKNKTANGAGIPMELREFCRDENGKWCKDADLNVVLGPDKSFIAWDRTSIRWCRIPAPLETVLQSWLSPMGWKQGPPTFAALGKDGSFFVKTEYGAVTYSAPPDTRLSREFASLNENDMLANVDVSEQVFLTNLAIKLTSFLLVEVILKSCR